MSNLTSLHYVCLQRIHLRSLQSRDQGVHTHLSTSYMHVCMRERETGTEREREGFTVHYICILLRLTKLCVMLEVHYHLSCPLQNCQRDRTTTEGQAT